jgi:hypothetical protein
MENAITLTAIMIAIRAAELRLEDDEELPDDEEVVESRARALARA